MKKHSFPFVWTRHILCQFLARTWIFFGMYWCVPWFDDRCGSSLVKFQFHNIMLTYIKRLLHAIFHIVPGKCISPRLPYQAQQRIWRSDIDRGLIPETIWEISCHNLFNAYLTLTFSKHWLFYCEKDLWADKLRK